MFLPTISAAEPTDRQESTGFEVPRALTFRYTIDDSRYPISDNRYTINDVVDDSPIPDTTDVATLPHEADIKARFCANFIRTPRDETVIVEKAQYQGMHKIAYDSRPEYYWAHLWAVRFLRVRNKDLEWPLEGLLQIRVVSWKNSGLGDPETSLSGVCAIIANKHGLRIERRG